MNVSKVLGGAVLISAVSAAVPALAIPMLVNSSFEDPVLDPNTYRTYIVNEQIGTGPGDNWFVKSSNNSFHQATILITDSFAENLSPGDYYSTPFGGQFLAVAANTTQTTAVAQIVAPQPSHAGHYELSFYQSDYTFGTGGAVVVDVVYFVNLAQLVAPITFNVAGGSDWVRRTLAFDLGEVGTPMLRFTSVVGQSSLIDNVQLDFTPLGAGVPEPGSLPLALLALAGFTVIRRKSVAR